MGWLREIEAMASAGSGPSASNPEKRTAMTEADGQECHRLADRAKAAERVIMCCSPLLQNRDFQPREQRYSR